MYFESMKKEKSYFSASCPCLVSAANGADAFPLFVFSRTGLMIFTDGLFTFVQDQDWGENGTIFAD
jgi:hypothetical protein